MTRSNFWRAGVVLSLIACGSAAGSGSRGDSSDVAPFSVTPREQDYQVVNTYPHDQTAWTQGLVFHNGSLFEGTGKEDSSYVREVDLVTGKVKRQHKIAPEYFGEGIAIVNDRLYQLTWQSGKGFVYDLANFTQVGEWTYQHEGWGLTYDGTNLILSDGTSTLRFLNPRTMAVVRTIQVTDAGVGVENLNELEIVKGEIFANVWLSDRIARIDPASGRVNGWINLAGLLPDSERNRYEYVDVLNGIAYDSTGDRLFVTGKYWPKLYEIKLVPVE